MKKINIKSAAIILLSLFVAPGFAFAQDAAPAAAAPAAAAAAATAPTEIDYTQMPEPMKFAKDQYAQALKLNAQAPSASRDAQIKSFVDALVDYDQLAERSLGKHWPTIDAAKQTEFKALFRELLELNYLKKLSDKSFKDNYKIDWDRVVKTKVSAVVSCFTKQKDVETELEIVLHAVNKNWEIYDIMVDGASLAQTYQKKYAKKIDAKGIDGILADMKAEIAKLKK